MSGPMMPGQMGPQGFMGPMINGQPGPSDATPFTMPNIILPGMNDSPLEFNMNKNKPPMPIETSNGKDESQKRDSPNDRSRRRGDKRDRDRERRDDKDKDKENNSGSNEGMNPQATINPWSGVMGMGYPVMGMNMIVDPNMMGMNNYSMMQPIMSDGTIMPQVSNSS